MFLKMSRVLAILIFALSIPLYDATAQNTIMLEGSADLQWHINPTTLEITAWRSTDQTRVLFSEAQQQKLPTANISSFQTLARWTAPHPSGDLKFTCKLNGNDLIVTIASPVPSNTTRTVTFPIIKEIDSQDEWIMPFFEGVRITHDNKVWRNKLLTIKNESLLEKLSFPAFSLHNPQNNTARVYLIQDQFHNTLTFSSSSPQPKSSASETALSAVDSDKPIQLTITHAFTPVQKERSYTVRFSLDKPDDLLLPAKKYRTYLKQTGQFVSLKDKIKITPKAQRLIGAIHAYVWGPQIVDGNDLSPKAAKAFATKIIIAENQNHKETLTAKIWSMLTPAEQTLIKEIAAEEWVNAYQRRKLAAILDRLIRTNTTGTAEEPISSITQQQKIALQNLELLAIAFPGVFDNTAEWGGGISTRMITQLQEAGIKRINLSTGGLNSTNFKPQAAEAADKAGYLFGPYDSYHSIHHPDTDPEQTWDTAQFDLELYNTGGIINAQGKPKHGFKKRGYKLSPLMAKPYVAKRVNNIKGGVNHTGWFVDCDAFGEVYDDYASKHTQSQIQGAVQRLDRMKWLSSQHDLVVGSEGGSSYAIPAIHFAHGMMTPVIGWGDPLRKDKKSKYYVGRYYPDSGPDVFMKTVPLQDKYVKLYYDPASRLPLYQAAFHDAVIATHHWSNASLKYSNTIQTIALLEQLYNVPPMYHLNQDTFKKQKDTIVNAAKFFQPIHEATVFTALTELVYLTNDCLVQKTVFGEKTVIYANFGDTDYQIDDKTNLAAGSIIAKLIQREQILHYKP
ncbi:glycoside hydrolase [Poriferisphaera sp. WC338]|uniref:glycoside hydrolase n=1 Tax=Poriferisphaera sp. WC338 TaxID=3425129 RepID=UPI003D81A7C8